MQDEKQGTQHTTGWLLLAGALAIGLPALVLSRLMASTGDPELQPVLGALIFGIGIVGAAFLLAWAAEVAELDISQALALAFVAFVAVLPEYAVDIYLAWQAGADPGSEYASLAAANMTGGNRLLVGLGWSVVVLLFWLRQKREVVLSQGVSLELAFLVIGALYSLSLFFKGSISLLDSAVLFPIFLVYIWLSGRGERHEPELIGPSLAIASLGKTGRRTVMVLLFIYAAGVIVLSAEPFAENLIDTGERLGIDKFFLIQWLAPPASEAPEMLVAAYFTLRGNPGAALIMLISATVNQWTLLVGSLPIAYSLSFGQPASLPLVWQQQVEFLLTMAQTLFAVLLVAKSRISWQGATTLLVLFAGQLVFPGTKYPPTLRFRFPGPHGASVCGRRGTPPGCFPATRLCDTSRSALRCAAGLAPREAVPLSLPFDPLKQIIRHALSLGSRPPLDEVLGGKELFRQLRWE